MFLYKLRSFRQSYWTRVSASLFSFFFLMIRRPPRSTLFPYTTLFRSAVHPASGELQALVFDRMEKQRFQCFIDEMAKLTKNRKTILVIDNASWHKADLDWHHIQPLFLPTYSPDMNPIERLWRVMKDRYFNNWYTDNYESLEDRVCSSLLEMMNKETEVASICNVK